MKKPVTLERAYIYIYIITLQNQEVYLMLILLVAFLLSQIIENVRINLGKAIV